MGKNSFGNLTLTLEFLSISFKFLSMGFVLHNIQVSESKFDQCIFVFFHRSYSCQHFFFQLMQHILIVIHQWKKIHYSYLDNENTLTMFDCAAQLQLLLKDKAILSYLMHTHYSCCLCIPVVWDKLIQSQRKKLFFKNIFMSHRSYLAWKKCRVLPDAEHACLVHDIELLNLETFYTDMAQNNKRADKSYFIGIDVHIHIFLSYPQVAKGHSYPKSCCSVVWGRIHHEVNLAQACVPGYLLSPILRWLCINRDPLGLHQLLILPTRQFKSRHGGQQKAIRPAQRSVPWTTFSSLSELHRQYVCSLLQPCLTSDPG